MVLIMTLSPIDLALSAAIEVAVWPPLEGHGFARVPWRLIETLRERLEAAGIDWREVKSENARRRPVVVQDR